MSKKKKNKKSKKKITYDKLILDSQEVLNGMNTFFNTLDENHIAIDEIVIHMTNEDTGKSKKIHLFKDFLKFTKKLSKKLSKTKDYDISKGAK